MAFLLAPGLLTRARFTSEQGFDAALGEVGEGFHGGFEETTGGTAFAVLNPIQFSLISHQHPRELPIADPFPALVAHLNLFCFEFVYDVHV